MNKKPKNLGFYLVRGLETFVSYWSGYRITPKPSVMYLELTYRCNCRCKFCERWKIDPKLAKKELTTKEVKRLLVEARQLGVKNVGFTGGEPFLREDIFEIGKFAKKIGLDIVVASNGTLINKKNIKEIAATFGSVAISMDGITPKTHDFIRGVKGVYEAAMNALALFKEHRVPVTVNMVITKKNFMEIDEYVQFFSQKDIPIQLTPVQECEATHFKVKKALKQIDAKKFGQEWATLSRKYPFLKSGFYRYVPTFLSEPRKLLRTYVCFAAAVMFFVNPYGEMFPCEFNRVKMGNIKNEPLAVIWKRAKNLRRKIASPKRSCICWNHCVVPLCNKLTRFIALKRGI